jgi:signal transduction histidine kinase
MLSSSNGNRAARGEASDTIRASATQLLEVVNDILELARAESGSIEINPRRVRLHDVLDDLQSMLVRLGAASDIDVNLRLPSHLPTVTADAARLREVVVNLVDNAIKYTPNGGSIEVSAEPVQDHVRVLVTDTGVGIPAEVGDRVFEPFYRVTGTRPQRDQASSGLGLALTRRWVEAQGGVITWAPNPRGGTIFEFTVPIHRNRSGGATRRRPPSVNGRRSRAAR